VIEKRAVLGDRSARVSVRDGRPAASEKASSRASEVEF